MRNSITPLKLFMLARERKLNWAELRLIKTWQETYPYFSLLHFINAKQTHKREDLFLASAYASDRSLLKAYIENGSIAAQNVWPEAEKRSKKVTAEPVSKVHNELFAIVDFDRVVQKPKNPEIPFFVWHDEPYSPRNEFLNLKIKSLTSQYLDLPKKIQTELTEFRQSMPIFIPAKEEIEVEVEEENSAFILDKFLENPILDRMAPDDEVQPDEDAVASIEEQEEIVTETMAKILWKQGETEDAIEMYEKLSLLFPEKSDYFGVQIKKIKRS
ncbi:MAG: hypothetical protein AAFR66_13325 [Bacteroidota bacterium]